MRRAFLAAVALACAACSAIAGLSDDFTVETAPTAPPPDGGQADAPLPPGAVDDGGLPDVTAPPDAGPPPPFCETRGLFCTDFEGSASLTVDWTRTETNGGTPKIVTDAGLDASRALEALMTETGGTATVVAWRTVANAFPVGTTIELHFFFRVHQKATDYAVLGAIQFGGIEHGLAMYDNSKCGALPGSCFDENDQSPTGHTHDPTGAVPLDLDVWHHGTVSLTHTGNGYAGKVMVDGATVDNRTVGAMPANADTTKIEVGVGSFFCSGHGTNDVFIDDVKVTQNP